MLINMARITAATLVATAVFAPPSGAQTMLARQAMAKSDAAVRAVVRNCARDVRAYCTSVTPGEGRIMFCIMAHGNKLSPRCGNTLFEVSRDFTMTVNSIVRAASVCARDAKRLCAGVPIGEGRVAQCLMNQRYRLSRRCGRALAGMRAQLR